MLETRPGQNPKAEAFEQNPLRFTATIAQAAKKGKAQVKCPDCNSDSKKFGFFGPQRIQRYRCKQCEKTFGDIPERPMDSLRIDHDKAMQIINLLVEGVGIRAIQRLTGIHRDRVLSVLEVAGRKCASLLDAKIRNVPVESVQCDEIFCFVRMKDANNKTNNAEFGGQFTFLAVDRTSKLILSHLVGKRDATCTDSFMADLRKRVAERTQITTDGFQGYLGAVYDAFGSEVDFARQVKQYANYSATKDHDHRYAPANGVISIKTSVHIGNPNKDLISTSHVERTNLSVRLFNRRFTRLTLGFSKKLANLRHAVALFVAHFNFCRIHSTHKLTPAMEAGITSHVWSIAELLTSTFTESTLAA